LDLQLPVQSVPIPTNVVSSNPNQAKEKPNSSYQLEIICFRWMHGHIKKPCNLLPPIFLFHGTKTEFKSHSLRGGLDTTLCDNFMLNFDHDAH
jgi:hypothetical protein